MGVVVNLISMKDLDFCFVFERLNKKYLLLFWRELQLILYYSCEFETLNNFCPDFLVCPDFPFLQNANLYRKRV